MKVFQVKYNIDCYAYYKSEKINEITKETKFYKDYLNCKNDSTDPLTLLSDFEQNKLRESLITWHNKNQLK